MGFEPSHKNLQGICKAISKKAPKLLRLSAFFWVVPPGIEPGTLWLWVRCSRLLKPPIWLAFSIRRITFASILQAKRLKKYLLCFHRLCDRRIYRFLSIDSQEVQAGFRISDKGGKLSHLPPIAPCRLDYSFSSCPPAELKSASPSPEVLNLVSPTAAPRVYAFKNSLSTYTGSIKKPEVFLVFDGLI